MGKQYFRFPFRFTTTDHVGNGASAESQADVPRVTKYYYHPSIGSGRGGGVRVAMRVDEEGGDAVYYLHTDHLGSTSLATDENGNEVARQGYYPYSDTRYATGTLPTDRRFTGQRWEAALGLYDYKARFYDPVLGRFISADTIVPNPGNPQLLNRYSYAGNNPVLYNDPDGHCGPLCIAGLIAVGAILLTVPSSNANPTIYMAEYMHVPTYRQGLSEVRRHTDLIVNYAENYGVPPIALAGGIAAQGNAATRPFGWDWPEQLQLRIQQRLTGDAPSVGIAQITPGEAAGFGIMGDLFDPEVSIECMAAKLQSAQERISYWEQKGYEFSATDRFMLTLIAENSGAGIVNKFVKGAGHNWQNLLRHDMGAWRVLARMMAYVDYLQTQGWSLSPGVEPDDIWRIIEDARLHNEWIQ